MTWGSDSFGYAVHDGKGGVSYATVSIEIPYGQPPSVDLIYPNPDIVTVVSYEAGSLGLSANASDSDGSVTKVEFYCDGVKVGEPVLAMGCPRARFCCTRPKTLRYKSSLLRMMRPRWTNCVHNSLDSSANRLLVWSVLSTRLWPVCRCLPGGGGTAGICRRGSSDREAHGPPGPGKVSRLRRLRPGLSVRRALPRIPSAAGADAGQHRPSCGAHGHRAGVSAAPDLR